MKYLILILLLFPTVSHSQDLFRAAENGDVNTVEEVIKSGRDINARDSEYGNTALIIAAGAGNVEIVKLLLDAGADIGATGFFEITAVRAASGNEHWDIVKLLKNAKADKDAPLIKAIKNSNIKEVEN